GCILSVKINPLYSPDPFNLNHIRIKISYDNHSEPDIDVPIGPFFGSGLGEAEVKGLFVGMSSSGAYYCFFPMPFKQGIKIEMENSSYDSGGEFFSEIGFTKKYPAKVTGAEIGYLGAKYNRAWPAAGKDDYRLFKYAGKGTVVGQVMTVEPVKPEMKQWWEGDLRIFIDDSSQARFNGTGHEDEYQGGWSNFWMSNPYSLPLFGLPKATGLKNIGGQLNGSVTVYRFWPGGIPFRKWIKISTEHGTENKKTANYSSLVFFYFLPEF
ncbi:MAG TPA: DUF2961 domain-containing protein, partial [Bacteroidetes bacterium]|nr:DUF2961 domain-containing protein [Bacteroidota bacterium]